MKEQTQRHGRCRRRRRRKRSKAEAAAHGNRKREFESPTQMYFFTGKKQVFLFQKIFNSNKAQDHNINVVLFFSLFSVIDNKPAPCWSGGAFKTKAKEKKLVFRATCE